MNKKRVLATLCALMITIVSIFGGKVCVVTAASIKSGDYTYTINADNTATITQCSDATSTTINIPTKLDDHLVTRIGGNAFVDCANLLHVSLPRGVNTVRWDSFSECNKLVTIEVILGNETYSSVNGCLYNKAGTELVMCPAGKKVVQIAATATKIGDNAFYKNTHLTTVTGLDNVTVIGDCAFSDCSNLASITSSAKITSIGKFAFYRCTQLASLPLTDNVKTIGEGALAYCESLENIQIPKGLTRLESHTFEECKKMETITIPASVTYIGSSVFRGCDYLNSINVEAANPNYCSKDGVLYNKAKTELLACGGDVQDVVIPYGVTTIHSSAFSYCAYLRNVVVPATVQEIGASAFSYCRKLKSVGIPRGVTTIKSYTFNMCDQLESITLPDTVTTIEYKAFSCCTRLKNIVIPASVTSVGDEAFLYHDDNMVIDTPANSYMASYAKENGITSVAKSFPPVVKPTVKPTTKPVIKKKVTVSKVTKLKLKKGKRWIKVSFKKIKGVKYKVAYSTSKKALSKVKNGSFKKIKKVSMKGISKNAVTLKKLKSKKKYYVKVCAYKVVKGKKIIGKWSGVKYVKVR